ncbi:hypothetical protein AB835_01650 [Candidatus Endobugula sertula]|uniref:DUF302 domain-containing protein n=1 Tax=Candidatus Endobugula sertula TaxID=62101 RepID=A0A1D2QT84_9GAMM|nr:hypothetical protein AB835_01650 [Candidatus Endobugula sertula]
MIAHFNVAHAQEDKSGMVHVKSSHNVKNTTDKLEIILGAKGMVIFKRIDHSAAAKKIDKELRPTELVIFGNPKVGTPLMQCDQSVALDLPQKILVWEDNIGSVWLTYNDPQYLVKRHNIIGCEDVLKKISDALNTLANAAAR